MKKNLTELVFILDRSGSMQGLEGDTIGGFNAMIEKQKKEPGEAFVSTASMLAPRKRNSQPHFSFCRWIISFTRRAE